MRCEICGAPITKRAYRVVVDRSEMIACARCAFSSSATIIEIIDLERRRRERARAAASPRRFRPRSGVVEEVVEDYPRLIKEARERMGLTRELLATMVGEKVSTIRRIEDGSLQPPIPLARKLEKVLKIKLVEEYEEEYEGYGSSVGYELTLGDIVEFKGGE